MLVIAGLGNPGKNYENTRHNVGFMVIDQLAKEWNIELNQNKFNGLYGTGFVSGKKVLLVKPLTYMNLSGECLRPLMDYYDVDNGDLTVIYDDLDLPTGKIRLRTKGSAGGHNGIKSLIQHLGTSEFDRIRIGIGRPVNGMKVVDYVLGSFNKEEVPDIDGAIDKSVKACEASLSKPFLEVMNEFNAKV
ncbi:aminoacyl-tRNA hydrolase [Bacillus spizizenii]|uniref:Peptidyl-tRNA hydrolase n=2 Tax=Bacillus spizizenii TaxID=96241 RepID=A0A9Q4DRM2_BACSC|nr:aminoacyl-tRNA hydrolase [Bacillus spizizenii]KFI02174.1 peptidyl-tRNA hydrolase [Bacillus sp. BSC154]QCJ19183.1 aminoacyl-tRNA hydrolase [Bacillus subtilis]ADM36113.1 peptidyl-tRNA hydrolase [Bacillus spizizenii str. W23]AJW85590.1 peptidyl-tRNA hydrolase [Bacillus spizizenii]EFG94161.1 peptidyl-tRNA hydrolase [Bacillus spizizenii ATCC 6633 = JCM 2499]